MQTIKFMKKAFYLNVSDAEAVTFFKSKIQEARTTVTMRKFDNLAHLYQGYRKEKSNAKAEEVAKKNMGQTAKSFDSTDFKVSEMKKL